MRERANNEVRRTLSATSLVPLVISFGDPLNVAENTTAREAAQPFNSFIAGLRAGHTTTYFQGDQAVVQVYLTPMGLRQILGVPGSEIANGLVRLEDVAPSLAALAEPLAEALTWRDRLDLASIFHRLVG